MKLSIVYGARDDRYGDDINCVNFTLEQDKNFKEKNIVLKFDNIQRIRFALENNLKTLEKYFKDDFEIIYVDWSPVNEQYLHMNPELNDLMMNPCVKNVVVPPDVVKQQGIDVLGFQEYFAKNVGIRNALGEFILVSNPDEIISEELVKNMMCIYESRYIDCDDIYFRCYSRKDCDHELKVLDEGLCFGKDVLIDIIGGPAAGDFILTKRINFIKITGFNEVLVRNVTNVDGQCIYKLYKNNMHPIFLGGSIMHLHHKKHDRSGHVNYLSNYENGDNWGLNNISSKRYENNIIFYL